MQRLLLASGVVGLCWFSIGCEARFGSGSAFVPSTLPPEAPDPPGRVARISYLENPVSFLPAGSDIWAPADLNRPVTTGDEIWTPAAGRAELHLGSAAIRLEGRTHLAVLDLDDDVVQAKLAEGSVEIRLRTLGAPERFEIDTPNSAITFSREGEFDVDVRDDTTNLIVRSGAAEITTPRRAFSAGAGRQVRIAGTVSVTYKITAAPAPDAFDAFCRARDRREERSESAAYLSPDVIGYAELDDRGIWLTHSAWGAYWVPRHVPDDWAPYRFGCWSWIDPWGWTWIDAEPWGFATSHYGRWMVVDGLWSWFPGPRHVQAVYAPALVVFAAGGRPDFQFFYWTGKAAAVAWLPLAPGEVYVPPYRCSRGYLGNVNRGNTILDSSVELAAVDPKRQKYANVTAAGAITLASRDAFTANQMIAGASPLSSPREAGAVRVTGSLAPVAPTSWSLARRASPSRAVIGPPDTIRSRQVTIRRSPPVALAEKERPLQRADEQRARAIEKELRQEKPPPSPKRRRRK